MTEVTIYEYSPKIKGFEIRAFLEGNTDFEVEMGQTIYKITRLNFGEHTFISIYLTPIGFRPATNPELLQKAGL